MELFRRSGDVFHLTCILHSRFYYFGVSFIANIRCREVINLQNLADQSQAYLARIAEVNEAVHAVNELNPDALEIAAGLDLERLAGTIRG